MLLVIFPNSSGRIHAAECKEGKLGTYCNIRKHKDSVIIISEKGKWPEVNCVNCLKRYRKHLELCEILYLAKMRQDRNSFP